MVTEVSGATGVVVTVNVVVVAPAATVTVAGTFAAAVLLLDRITTAPPVGAAWVSVTVPVEEVPPVTEAGLSPMLLRTPANTVRLALWTAPWLPEMVTVVFTATELVVTVNVAEVALGATVTLAGTCAAEVLLLERVTTAPPAGAGPLSVTIPVEVAPAGKEDGLKVTEPSTAAVTVRLVLCVAP